MADVGELFRQTLGMGMVERPATLCEECGLELAAGSPDLRLELTDDDQPIAYCLEC
jgi:hypothetical protein